MCGIGAIISPNAQSRSNKALMLSDSLSNRGPDANGTFNSDKSNCTLVHTRLAIIDLDVRSNQPMTNEHVTISFNGEIYNFNQIRNKLIDCGETFVTQSDTEVILKQYFRYGIMGIKDLRGMFSILILDEDENKLHAIRDPFGIKPLYYSKMNDELIFSSSIRSFKNLFKNLSICSSGLTDFKTFGFVMEPNTIFAEISSVNAGAILTIDLDQISITEDQWMQNDESNHKTIPNSYHANLPEALDDTISSHMVSDCEINFFLSAGLDSTLLVDRARNLKHKNNIYTTTLGFSDYSGSKNDETIWANLNSVNMGVKNKCVLLNSDELKESVIEYFNAMDQPTLDGFNTYLISKSAKMDQFKVSISGVGADEIFQGYPSFFQISFLMNFKKYIPLSSIIWWIIGCATFLYGCLNGNEKLRYLHKFRLDLIDLYILRRCYSLSHLFKNGCKDLDRYRRKFSSVIDEQDDVVSSIRKLEISIYMKNQLLRDTDWASMANSHEIRTPFVDKVFFKNVLKIEKKKGIKFSKSSLKSLFSSIIDKRFLNRKKTGFSTPLKTISQDCFDVKINSRNDWTNFILNRYLENWKS